jgi:MoaA/NifB/PqqE/SkfB family radical SAM enzyme
MADPTRLARGLDAMQRAGIKYVCLTGGEPLLYPDLLPSLAYAQVLGLKTLLVTNGALLTPKLIQNFREVALDTLIISIDAASEEVHDRHRGLPGLAASIKEVLPLVHLAGIKAVASVTLSRLIDDLDALVSFVRDLGFTRLTFSYPLTRLNSSYLGFADNDLVAISPEELDHLFTQILEVKGRAPIIILNPRLALEDARRQIYGLPSRFPCLAGFKYFFADWNLEVFRCHFLPDTLGPLEEIDQITPIRDGCNACSIDCYRDPSVLQYSAVSVADTLAAWRRGEVLQGFKSLLNLNNVLSLTALIEGRHWVK